MSSLLPSFGGRSGELLIVHYVHPECGLHPYRGNRNNRIGTVHVLLTDIPKSAPTDGDMAERSYVSEPFHRFLLWKGARIMPVPRCSGESRRITS